MLHALIMAGGGGTRFWPRSRAVRPKQFLALGGERTLLQQSLERIEGLADAERTWIITAAAHRAEVARQASSVPRDNVVGEPCGRDTAACIGLGAALIARHDADATMLVLPADHRIEPAAEFRRAAQVAAHLADEFPQSLVVFGIPPTHPATGYGYIQRGAETTSRQGIPVYRVQRFREKPDRALAEQMLASGDHFWNAGIFVWKARTVLAALEQFQPQLYAALQRVADAWPTPQRDPVFEREYQALQRISIDYAVMEKARDVLMVPATFQWDDVGSWLAVERHNPQDANGNTTLALHAGIDTKNCVIVGDSDRLIATVDVKDLLIIQDGDAILIAHRGAEGRVKELVELLRQKKLENHL